MAKLLRWANRGLISFFFEPISSRYFVAGRVFLGGSLLGYYAFSIDSLLPLYSSDGLVGYVVKPPAGLASATIVYGVWAVALVSSLFFSLGLFTRTSGLLLWCAHAYFTMLGATFNWGWMRILQPLLLFTVLANCGAAYSLDAWLASRKGRPIDATTWIYPLRLIQLHLSCIYLSASLHRLNDFAWLQGDMLFFALDYNLYTRIQWLDLSPYREWFHPICWAALAIEILAIVGVWWRPIMRTTLYLLIPLHLGLELLSVTGRWQSMMLGAVLTLTWWERATKAAPSFSWQLRKRPKMRWWWHAPQSG